MKATFGEKIFYTCNYIALLLFAATCLLPIIHIIAMSFSSPTAVNSGFVGLWPVEATVAAYDTLINQTNTVRSFVNSVVITVIGVALSMVLTVLAAYPLSRQKFYFRRFFTLAIVFTTLFGGGLIPNYLVVNGLGLVNTYWALWLPSLVSAFNMLVLRTFIENLPKEIEESSRIDGCGELRLLLRIVLPLSMPVIAALSLFYGVGYWNMFLQVLIYIQDSRLHNMPVLIQNMIQSQQILTELQYIDESQFLSITPESVKSAGIIVMLVPMLLVYPWLQKYFVKGVLIGSIKG